MLGSDAVICYQMGLQAKEVITDDTEGLFLTDMNPGVSYKFGFSLRYHCVGKELIIYIPKLIVYSLNYHIYKYSSLSLTVLACISYLNYLSVVLNAISAPP